MVANSSSRPFVDRNGRAYAQAYSEIEIGRHTLYYCINCTQELELREA